MSDKQRSGPFDAETWSVLPDYLANLPGRVLIRVWGNQQASHGEREAARMVKGLVDGFDQITMELQPRQENYPYYPVIGVFGYESESAAAIDFGLRLIGLPAGLQITSMIAAIQAVAFKGATLEAKTRIQLHKLQHDVTLELLTAAEDEYGANMAKTVFGLAVASPHVRTYLIMADVFPEALLRYSARHLPYLVVNGRVHADGELGEEAVLRQIALAVR